MRELFKASAAQQGFMEGCQEVSVVQAWGEGPTAFLGFELTQSLFNTLVLKELKGSMNPYRRTMTAAR